jgi:hypothetical protein
MSVIKHDFGSENRRAARRLQTLLKLNALHESNVRANPLPYLERASERIYQLVLFEAVEAATSPSASPPSSETIRVNKAEYERFLACLSIIEDGLAKLVSDDDT